jgi:kanamycin nucleotidyltransferase
MEREERIQLARDISAAFIERYGEDVVATGIRGSVARLEDVEQSNLNVVIVTKSAEPAGAPRALLHGPIAVECYVVGENAYRDEARMIGPWWPVRADQFLHHTALHDPSEFWNGLRRVYEKAVEEAPADAFVRAETANIVQAVSWAYKARAAARSTPEMAQLAIAESALRAVLAIGLRARFVFKNVSHALRFAPQLPGSPESFGQSLRSALSSQLSAEDAVGALEDAIEKLLDTAMENKVPVVAEGVSEFL